MSKEINHLGTVSTSEVEQEGGITYGKCSEKGSKAKQRYFAFLLYQPLLVKKSLDMT